MREVNRSMRWSWLLTAAAFLALVGGAGGAEEKPPEPPKPPAGKGAKASPYILRQGDQIAVAISPQKEYDCEAIVLPDGKVFLRNIGTFDAEGATLEGLEKAVTKALDGELVNYRVTVTLLRMAPAPAPKPVDRRLIMVSGAVGSPGPIEYEEGLTIRRALVLAGGLLREANHRDIRVYPKLTALPKSESDGERAATALPAKPDAAAVAAQAKRGKLENGNYFRVMFSNTESMLAEPAPGPAEAGMPPLVKGSPPPKEPEEQHPDLILWEGDAIEVRLRPPGSQSTVRLSGLVRAPGIVNLTTTMRLEDLFKEGGLSPLADPKRVEVYRGDAKKPHRVLDLQAEIQARPGEKFTLQANDEVYVPRIGDSVIVIGGVQNPGWRSLKKVTKVVNGQKVETWQSIRDFFLQDDKEITAGNQDLPGTYNPNMADLKDVEVIRDGKLEKKVNLIEVTRKANRPDNIELKPGDIVYLPPRGRPNRGPLYYLRDLPYLGFLFGLF